MYCSESVLLASRYNRRLWIDLKKDSCVDGAGALGWVSEPRFRACGAATVPLLDALVDALLEEADTVVLAIELAALSFRDAADEGVTTEAFDAEL
jgi:hypothetical protein